MDTLLLHEIEALLLEQDGPEWDDLWSEVEDAVVTGVVSDQAIDTLNGLMERHPCERRIGDELRDELEVEHG